MAKFKKDINSPNDGKPHDVYRNDMERLECLFDYYEVIEQTAIKLGLAVANDEYGYETVFRKNLARYNVS